MTENTTENITEKMTENTTENITEKMTQRMTGKMIERRKMTERMIFPHPQIRPVQQEMLSQLNRALGQKGHIIVHAPTGIGKTAAALAAALHSAQENGYCVFFLTSRHTQHAIAIETLEKMKQRGRHGNDWPVVADLIGKRNMCGQKGSDLMSTGEFYEFCRSLVEGRTCEFYANTYSGRSASTRTKAFMTRVRESAIIPATSLVERAAEERLCPYETATMLAAKANVIICDYYYLLSPAIRDIFLKRTGKQLEKSIIIVDEAHNLPRRCRELMTSQLTSFVVRAALREAKKFGYQDIVAQLSSLQEVLLEMTAPFKTGDERLLRKEDFTDMLTAQLRKDDRETDYETLVADLAFAAEAVLQTQHKSFCSAISHFLDSWTGEDEGYVRIIALKHGKREPLICLSYQCLDPSLVMQELIDKVPSLILMSGTLLPTVMYRDLLGFGSDTALSELESPFPRENRLNLVVPKTTTKYDFRSERTFQDMAAILKDMIEAVPGNTAVFFPSYALRDSVHKFLHYKLKKPIVKELPAMNGVEKKEMLDRFKELSGKDGGGVLLAASSGNFGEGIDLPGDLLKAVVIVGLPLSPPDLVTRQLIAYYDHRFDRGWDYGYVMPAFIRCLQNAGRCIRSETDKGLIAFLDERYTMDRYYPLFPKDWHVKISHDVRKEIKGFFGEPKDRL